MEDDDALLLLVVAVPVFEAFEVFALFDELLLAVELLLLPPPFVALRAAPFTSARAIVPPGPRTLGLVTPGPLECTVPDDPTVALGPRRFGPEALMLEHATTHTMANDRNSATRAGAGFSLGRGIDNSGRCGTTRQTISLRPLNGDQRSTCVRRCGRQCGRT
ncbi:MAG: hypothetical protein AB7S36_03270 [Planctomycetota bacterium]